MAEGNGTMQYAGGGVFDGQWKANLREGRGDAVCRRRRARGPWKADLREGRGTLLYADGGVFEGHWRRICPRGAARLCANGEVYEGEWSAGDGCGTLWFRDGRVFVNSYTAGEEVVGKGVLWETDGTARRVRNGKPVEEISLEEALRVAEEHGLQAESLPPHKPIPGGYKIGDKLYFIGASQTTDTGDRLVHGELAEVIGAAAGEWWAES